VCCQYAFSTCIYIHTYTGHILTTGFGNCIALPLMRLATHEAECVTNTYAHNTHTIHRSHMSVLQSVAVCCSVLQCVAVHFECVTCAQYTYNIHVTYCKHVYNIHTSIYIHIYIYTYIYIYILQICIQDTY